MSKKNLTVSFVISLFISTGIAISACSPNQMDSQSSKRELIFPKHTNYYGLVNMDGSATVLVLRAANVASYAKEGSSDFVRFNLPDDPDCFGTGYHAYVTRLDGQLHNWI